MYIFHRFLTFALNRKVGILSCIPAFFLRKRNNEQHADPVYQGIKMC